MNTQEELVEVVPCSMDGSTDPAPWLEGKVYLDVTINGDSVGGWVKPSTAALIKGLDKQKFSPTAVLLAELAQIGSGMEAAGKAMRAATAQIDHQNIVIAQYRSKNAAHERMVSDLLKLLKDDDLDAARDIVSAEYDAIHGPRD